MAALDYRRVSSVRRSMTNVLEQAINCDDGDRAAKIIQDALGNRQRRCCEPLLPEGMACRRERRARYIGTWLATEVRYLAS